MNIDIEFPPFHPHWLLPGGHLQTIAGAYLPGSRRPYKASRHSVVLADGDRLILHDDRPKQWQPGDRIALLSHGLAGCHQSAYMQRVASRLTENGIRTFRLDLRNCGAGFGLANGIFHSARQADLSEVLVYLNEQFPASPVVLIGFSLSGNLTLNLAASEGELPRGNLKTAIAICPPIDLDVCSRNLSRGLNKFYDRHFVTLLIKALAAKQKRLPAAPTVDLQRRPRSLRELDDLVTAPLGGFQSAAHYYEVASPGPRLSRIRLPTLILPAADDPIVPAGVFTRFEMSAAVTFHLAEGGGHLGFFARRGTDRDCRWLDWRILQWIEAQMPCAKICSSR